MARSAGRAMAAVDTVTAATALHGPRKLGGRVKGVLGSSERAVKVQDVAHQAQPAKFSLGIEEQERGKILATGIEEQKSLHGGDFIDKNPTVLVEAKYSRRGSNPRPPV